MSKTNNGRSKKRTSKRRNVKAKDHPKRNIKHGEADAPIPETKQDTSSAAVEVGSQLELVSTGSADGSFYTRHRTFFQIVFFVLFTLFLISADSWLNTERKVFDWLTLTNSPISEKDRVVIVKIDEEDFDEIFQKRTPLDPVKVTSIIEKIAESKPKVLGVDILTSDEIHKSYIPKDYGIPIVWAAEPEKKEGKIEKIKLPLAGQPLAQNNYAALPESLKDNDGVNRLYRRAWNIEDTPFPIFSWMIYKLAYSRDSANKSADTEDRYVRFVDIPHQEIPARDLLKWELEERSQHLSGKIVLLGGMYGDSRDIQNIPFNSIFGVQLNALTIETEIYGQPQQPISGIVRFLLNFIAFPFFAIVFFRFRLLKALLIALSISVLSILSVSVFKYGYSGTTLLIPVFIWTLVLALLDLLLDKYKEIGSHFFETVRASIDDYF